MGFVRSRVAKIHDLDALADFEFLEAHRVPRPEEDRIAMLIFRRGCLNELNFFVRTNA
jgi:hypothetical protein